MSNPNNPMPVLSQTSPGLEAAALLSEPLPADPPTAHPSPVPEGQVTWAEGTVTVAALAQHQAATKAELATLADLRANETPELFRKAKAAISDYRAKKATITAKLCLLQELLGNRIDRTQGVVRKVIAIYLLLALGEVALNTASGVALGEEPWIAVISFIGVAAGAVALGWPTGSLLRDATDRIAAGPLPDQLRSDPVTGTQLRPLFLPDPGGRMVAFPISFWFYLAGLLVMAGTNAMLVGGMRVEAGMGAAWGPVAAMLVVAAAAPPYLLRNQVADVWEAARREYQNLDTLEQAEARMADEHTASQRRSQAHQQAMPASINAQYLAALAGGLGQIATSQTHIVGHIATPGSIPIQTHQLRAQIQLAQPVGAEVVIDDEIPSEAAAPDQHPTSGEGPAAMDSGRGADVDLTGAIRPGAMTGSVPFALDPAPASGNGHRP